MIYVELKDRNKIPSVIGWGSVLCACMYITIGIFGYLTFTVQPENYDDLDLESTIARSSAIGAVNYVD